MVLLIIKGSRDLNDELGTSIAGKIEKVKK